jgi:hypothetical protein
VQGFWLGCVLELVAVETELEDDVMLMGCTKLVLLRVAAAIDTILGNDKIWFCWLWGFSLVKSYMWRLSDR